ncbi:hypothetical protein [Blastococcus montanus]|uniref:hypothetical protein n=1 Tax=Blastococcus montanus TaxID=3144973 RepID=UPI0032096C93
MTSREDVLRTWWEQLGSAVGEVVNQSDPEGLLDMGAPQDEYSSEIDSLTSLAVREDLTERSVLAVWERAFGPGSCLSQRPELLTSLTQQLLAVREERPSP